MATKSFSVNGVAVKVTVSKKKASAKKKKRGRPPSPFGAAPPKVRKAKAKAKKSKKTGTHLGTRWYRSDTRAYRYIIKLREDGASDSEIKRRLRASSAFSV